MRISNSNRELPMMKNLLFLLLLSVVAVVGACAHTVETGAAPDYVSPPSGALGIEHNPQIPLASENEPQSKLDDHIIKRVTASNPLVRQVITPEELHALDLADEKLSELSKEHHGIGGLKDYLVGIGRAEERIYITLIPRYSRNEIPYNKETAYRSGGSFSPFYGFGDYVSLRITISTISWSVVSAEELVM